MTRYEYRVYTCPTCKARMTVHSWPCEDCGDETPLPAAPTPWRVEVTKEPWCNIVAADDIPVNVDFEGVATAHLIVAAVNALGM